MMGVLHRFFWEDSKARGYSYAVTAVAGIVYAAVRSLAFHKPERQVDIELFVFLFISNFALVLLYCLRRRNDGPKPASALSYRIPLLLRFGGLAACLVLFGARRFSVSTVQAAIINQRLERAASAIEPDKTADLPSSQLKARFQRVSSIANTALENKITANPNLVEKVRINLAETLKTVNPGSEDARTSGVAAFVALVAYARYNNVVIALNVPTILFPHGETGNSMISQVPLKNGASWWQGSPQGNTIFAMPTPSSEPVFPVSHAQVIFNEINFNGFGLGRAFVGTDNESQVVIMNASIEGASQKLDSIVWLNIKFKASRIIYNGGPLYLGETSFENCLFEFGSDPVSQNVLAQIKAAGNQPVTLVSGL